MTVIYRYSWFDSYALILSVLLILSACNPTVKDNEDGTGHRVDFAELLEYALMDSIVYETDSAIHAYYGSRILKVGQLPGGDGQYFILLKEEDKAAYIAVRGTANLKNVLRDAEIEKAENDELGIPLHKGFMVSSKEAYDSLRHYIEPLRDQDYSFYLTGHSLGGAIAAILMMHLQHDDYTVKKLVTCGQPKVTTAAGKALLNDSIVFRMIDKDDPVPLVPPNNPMAAGGGYVHFGKAILLLSGKYFVGLSEELAEDKAVNSFWANLPEERLSDHFVANYLKNIRTKLDEQEEVLYNDRKNYE